MHSGLELLGAGQQRPPPETGVGCSRESLWAGPWVEATGDGPSPPSGPAFPGAQVCRAQRGRTAVLPRGTLHKQAFEWRGGTAAWWVYLGGGGCSRLSMQCKIFVEINSESLAPWWCMASLASYVSGASRGVLRPPPPASPCPVRLSTEPCPQFPKLPSRLTLCLAVPSFGRVRARGRGGSFQALAHRAERSPPRRVMSVMGPSTCSVSPDPALEGSTT